VQVLLRVVDRAEKTTDRVPLLAAALRSTAARLAAASTSVAGRLAAAVAGSAGGLRTAVASTAGRLAAAVASAAIRITAAAVAAAVVLPLALFEQALQPAEQIVLLPALGAAARSRSAGRLAATSTSVARRLAAAVAGSAGGLRTSIAGTAAGLTASIAGVAAGLTARGAALVVADHPVEEFETKRLTTNGDTENECTEEHHTLHRATSPLLVDHDGSRLPFLRLVTPRL